LWFIVPGLGVAVWLCKKKRIANLYVLLVGALLSCVLGYIAFWIFLVSRPWGEVYSWAVLILAGTVLVKLLVNARARKILFSFHVLMPFTLWCLTTIFYTSMVLGCHVPTTPVYPEPSCYLNKSTSDNVLPQQFADNVYQGHAKKLMGDWHGSDRPPLQSGIVLMEAPLTELTKDDSMSYRLLATFLQVLWVPAVWLLSKRLGLKNSQLAVVLILCLSSGFFFFNSIFTWPKLLAGSLGAVGLSLLVFEKPSITRWSLAGIAVGTSLLAHSAVAFAFMPLVIFLCQKRFFPGWKIALAGTSATLVLLVPWTAYQHFYDPPGNRLLKWGIAGVIPVDNNSFSHDLINSYSHAGLSGTLKNKFSNAYTIFYDQDKQSYTSINKLVGALRANEFYFIFCALGLLNIGWLSFWFKKSRHRLYKSGLDPMRIKYVLGLALVSLVFFTILMFGPDATIIHEGSYLTMILLFVGLAAIISTYSRNFSRTIIGLKLFYFLCVWMIPIYWHHSTNNIYVFWAVLSGFVIAYCLVHLGKRNPVDS